MPRILLLPGLAADERMFARLGDPEFSLHTPRLPTPEKKEALPHYARRVAEILRIEAGDIIGGSSFGSLVASTIAREQPVRALLLIGGALSTDSLRPIPGARMLQWLPGSVVRPMLRSDRSLQMIFGEADAEAKALARVMLDDTPDELLLRGGKMILDYHPASPPLCSAFAIHGALDRVMGPPPVPGCRVLAEAGHGIAWSHAVEVKQWLREVLGSCPN